MRNRLGALQPYDIANLPPYITAGGNGGTPPDLSGAYQYYLWAGDPSTDPTAGDLIRSGSNGYEYYNNGADGTQAGWYPYTYDTSIAANAAQSSAAIASGTLFNPDTNQAYTPAELAAAKANFAAMDTSGAGLFTGLTDPWKDPAFYGVMGSVVGAGLLGNLLLTGSALTAAPATSAAAAAPDASAGGGVFDAASGGDTAGVSAGYAATPSTLTTADTGASQMFFDSTGQAVVKDASGNWVDFATGTQPATGAITDAAGNVVDQAAPSLMPSYQDLQNSFDPYGNSSTLVDQTGSQVVQGADGNYYDFATGSPAQGNIIDTSTGNVIGQGEVSQALSNPDTLYSSGASLPPDVIPGSATATANNSLLTDSTGQVVTQGADGSYYQFATGSPAIGDITDATGTVIATGAAPVAAATLPTLIATSAGVTTESGAGLLSAATQQQLINAGITTTTGLLARALLPSGTVNVYPTAGTGYKTMTLPNGQTVIIGPSGQQIPGASLISAGVPGISPATIRLPNGQVVTADPYNAQQVGTISQGYHFVPGPSGSQILVDSNGRPVSGNGQTIGSDANGSYVLLPNGQRVSLNASGKPNTGMLASLWASIQPNLVPISAGVLMLFAISDHKDESRPSSRRRRS